MDDTIVFGLQLALAALVLMLLPVSYRIVTGPTQACRLQAIDAITMLLIGILIVLAVLQEAGMMIDVALSLAAFGFIGLLAISRYLIQGKVF